MRRRWPLTTLGAACEITSGGTPSRAVGSYWKGSIPWVSAKDLKTEQINDAQLHISDAAVVESATKIAPAGSLLILVRGMGLANGVPISEVTSPVAFNQDIRALQPSRDVQPRYLQLALRAVLSERSDESILSNAAHGTLKIDADALRAVSFPLPPLPEQQRIAGILDEALAGIATANANAERNLANAREVFESYLASTFAKRGTGWVDRQLATLCVDVTVGHVGPMKDRYCTAGIPFLRSQNIRPFELAMDDVMYIDDVFDAELKKSRLRPGDLAIVRTGYPGTAAVIPPDLTHANCADLVVVRPGKEVNPHFLEAFFNSSFGKALVLGKLVGAAQRHFNVGAAKAVQLHLPPLREQNTIVAAITRLRAETLQLSRLVEQKHAALYELKQSLLHHAFTGQL